MEVVGGMQMHFFLHFFVSQGGGLVFCIFCFFFLASVLPSISFYCGNPFCDNFVAHSPV